MQLKCKLGSLLQTLQNLPFDYKSAKSIIKQIYLLDEDKKYKLTFETKTGKDIYHMHCKHNYSCCIFCSHLSKSICHNYCFKCSENDKLPCGQALPGTYHINHDSLILSSEEPWITREPCSHFSRLTEESYYTNINCFGQENTLTAYEFLEGLYTGTANGHIPCQVCAALENSVYKRCCIYTYEKSKGKCTRLKFEKGKAFYRINDFCYQLLYKSR